jgi:hypothetical protein
MRFVALTCFVFAFAGCQDAETGKRLSVLENANRDLTKRLDAVNQELPGKFDAATADLSRKCDAAKGDLLRKLDAAIEDLSRKLAGDDAKLEKGLSKLDSLDSAWKQFQQSYSPEMRQRLEQNVHAAELAAQAIQKQKQSSDEAVKGVAAVLAEVERLKALCQQHEKEAANANLIGELKASVSRLEQSSAKMLGYGEIDQFVSLGETSRPPARWIALTPGGRFEGRLGPEFGKGVLVTWCDKCDDQLDLEVVDEPDGKRVKIHIRDCWNYKEFPEEKTVAGEGNFVQSLQSERRVPAIRHAHLRIHVLYLK